MRQRRSVRDRKGVKGAELEQHVGSDLVLTEIHRATSESGEVRKTRMRADADTARYAPPRTVASMVRGSPAWNPQAMLAEVSVSSRASSRPWSTCRNLRRDRRQDRCWLPFRSFRFVYSFVRAPLPVVGPTVEVLCVDFGVSGTLLRNAKGLLIPFRVGGDRNSICPLSW